MDARQFAESDRRAKELAELRNRIRGLEASVSRSVSEVGWLLGGDEQAIIKDAIQKARNLPPEEARVEGMRELLARLEDGAAKLAAAMWSAPGMEGLQAKEGSAEVGGETDIKKLLKSAIDDLTTKS